MGYNLERINEISDGDQDFIVAVVTTFIEEVSTDLITFEQQVASGNYKGIFQVSHKLKPNLEMLGMQASFDMNMKIHDWAKAETNLGDIAPAFSKLQGMINENIAVLKQDFNL